MFPLERDQAWFATQVRATSELHVGELLRERGYEIFIPLTRRRRRWSDRTVLDWRPLFAGYVFCSTLDSPVAKIHATPGVIRIVGVGRQPVPIPKDEIDAIRRAEHSGRELFPASFFEPGQRVRVHSGVLSGVEGRLIATKGADRLVLSISLLQRAVAVEIERDMVESVPNPLK